MISISPAGMATLYVSSHPDDFRSLLALIAAEFCPSLRPRTITEDPPASLNARSRPTLVQAAGEGDSVLSGASAVAWYLAFQGKKAGVDAKQQSQVWQWLSFADNEITPVSCAVVFPLMGVIGVDKKVREVFKCFVGRACELLFRGFVFHLFIYSAHVNAQFQSEIWIINKIQ